MERVQNNTERMIEMKKEKDLNVGWYLFALVGGIASGLMFSK
jgi:hypothetical protein